MSRLVNQLSVGDITYAALPARFVYVAVILDVWSRRLRHRPRDGCPPDGRRLAPQSSAESRRQAASSGSRPATIED
ncbi:hypothetical protein ACN2CC_07315 [Mesorhizobium muleiense]|uniref:hypothetical protein n=1 Tax=Mesorhizobium muleiense TaxID=1004279 RepID=UPI003AFA14C1